MSNNEAISIVLGQLAAREIDLEIARAQVFDVAYDELRRIARGLMRAERADHTLQPTEVVNEAYLRLAQGEAGDWKSRAHFFGVTVRAMRQLLVDHARAKSAAKRGGDQQRVTLTHIATPENSVVGILTLDQAITHLAALDERASRVVELRFFGGLTIDEIAVVLNISPRTVKGEWKFAKHWLKQQLDF